MLPSNKLNKGERTSIAEASSSLPVFITSPREPLCAVTLRAQNCSEVTTCLSRHTPNQILWSLIPALPSHRDSCRVSHSVCHHSHFFPLSSLGQCDEKNNKSDHKSLSLTTEELIGSEVHRHRRNMSKRTTCNGGTLLLLRC